MSPSAFAGLAVALGLGLGLLAAILVRDVGPPSRPPNARGGLILLSNSGPGMGPDAVSLHVEIRNTGFAGVSEMHVAMQFKNPRPGLHWTLVASGQYQIAPGAPVEAFCSARATKTSANVVTCPADGSQSDPVKAYRQGGLAVADRGNLFTLEGYDGYDPTTASMIEGGLPVLATPNPLYGQVKTEFPIRVPTAASGGTDTDYALAPIGARDLGDYGDGPKLRGGVGLQEGLVQATTLAPVAPADITSVRFAVPFDLGFVNLASASPPTVSADRLEWTSRDVQAQTIRYSLHDPTKEASILRMSFWAGAIASLAASLLVLGVELILVRRRA